MAAHSLENNVVTRKHTTVVDTKFNLVDVPMWFSSLNVVALTNNAFYGDRVDQESPLFVNDVLSYEAPTDLSQLYFKNYTAGSNCKIVASGVLLLESELKRLGLPSKRD